MIVLSHLYTSRTQHYEQTNVSQPDEAVQEWAGGCAVVSNLIIKIIEENSKFQNFETKLRKFNDLKKQKENFKNYIKFEIKKKLKSENLLKLQITNFRVLIRLKIKKN